MNTWQDLGTGCQDSTFDLGNLASAQYLKLVDESNPRGNGNRSKGFDVDGVKAFHSKEIGNTNNLPDAVDDVVNSDTVPVVIANVLANDTDIDGDTLTITAYTQPVSGSVTMEDDNSFVYTPDETFTGRDNFTYTVNDGNGGTDTATVTVYVNFLPQVTFTADPETITSGQQSTLTWSSRYADTCVVEPGIGSVDLDGSITVSPASTTTYTITASKADKSVTATVVITVEASGQDAPQVNISADTEIISSGAQALLSWTSSNAQTAFIDQGIGAVDINGSVSVSPAHTTTYTISVVGDSGSASKQITIKVTGMVEPQPEGTFGEKYNDLIPIDSTVESYNAKHFSLITGIVNDTAQQPVSGVNVRIHTHPEYGTATTNSDGRFSIPLEGGTTFTLSYHKDGFIDVHRQCYAGWNEIAVVENIVMTREDQVSTTITFDGNPDTVITHKSSTITDESGSRSCTMVFQGDNHAYQIDENNNIIHELATITTRASEFTTPESMPAVLPPASAFTYCAELSVDGAARVRFAKPVITWIDNFLGFDVGEIVPVGYYDRDQGIWKASDNGVVVRLLDTDSDGVVDALDVTGDDAPDDLDNDGSFSDEVTGLEDGSIYLPGSTFWRVAISHFSPWDCNWAWGPPPDATDPNPKGLPDTDQQKEEPKECERDNASFVEERSRIFHEDIPVPGTDMTLHYTSKRTQGYKYVITIPASGDTVPGSLNGVIVRFDIAGRSFQKHLPPQPNLRAEFIWDGLDYLGRRVDHPITSQASIGFEYTLIYYSGNIKVTKAFGQPGIYPVAFRDQQNIISWKHQYITITPGAQTISNSGGSLAEGWTLSGHHYSTPVVPVLFKGDGKTSKDYNGGIITTVAGSKTAGYSGDGGLATQAKIGRPNDIFVDSAGNIYIADNENNRIRKVDTNGIITTVAGNGTSGYGGDGGLATQAELNRPNGIFVDSANNIYIADTRNSRIRKVDTDGIITTVAGTGTSGYSGDGGTATQAELDWPRDIAVNFAGDIYIADTDNACIRKVDSNGIITTVAGNGTAGYSGDGGAATQAELNWPHGIFVDSADNIYIADTDNHRIRKVDTNGIITTVAGNGVYNYGNPTYNGDGIPATQAGIASPTGIFVDLLGNLYIADNWNNRIRKVDTDGYISTVAGNGGYGYSGDEGPAIRAELREPRAVCMDSTGNLYIACYWDSSIRKVTFNLDSNGVSGELYFPEKNGLKHIMSSLGIHQRTVDLDTGTVLRQFGYDQNNLVSITDRFGGQIVIERDGNGTPTAIISPDGIRTTLTIDSYNHLTQVTYANGSFYNFEYTDDGLMTAKIEPDGNRFEHAFDARGRLTDALNQEGGHWNYTRYIDDNSNIVTNVMTAENNLTTYQDHYYSTGVYESTITGPTGAQTFFTESSDGLSVTKSLPCGMNLEFTYGLDPEHGFKFVNKMTQTTQAGLQQTVENNKTYQDTDNDQIPDLITRTISLNNKITTLSNNVLLSQKSIR